MSEQGGKRGMAHLVNVAVVAQVPRVEVVMAHSIGQRHDLVISQDATKGLAWVMIVLFENLKVLS